MIYTIENDYLKLTFSNSGGEIHSILGKKDNTEYLWNGNEQHWKYHAPVLFPTIGKVVDGKYKVDGSVYELPQHGLARVRNFETLSHSNDSISFELNYDEDTLRVYPYKFSLIIKYTLKDETISIEYFVKNLDSNEMYFSVGAHPAFMCPILDGESINDYYFEFNKKETASIMELNKFGYFTNKRIPYLNNENIIRYTENLFENDALVFNNLNSSKVYLKSDKSSKYIEFDFEGFPYIALWSKPEGAPFVCIEPWFGHADFEDFNGSYNEKSGIQHLNVDETFNCCHKITIHQ